MQTFLNSFKATIRECFYGKRTHLIKLKIGERCNVFLCAKTRDARFNTNIEAHLGTLDEMSWGFRGQDPYNLALNLLYTFTRDEKFSRDHASEFSLDFLENIDAKTSYRISSELIMNWIDTKNTAGGIHVQ